MKNISVKHLTIVQGFAYKFGKMQEEEYRKRMFKVLKWTAKPSSRSYDN